MTKHLSRKGKTAPKRVLRLPDLDLAKRTVLNSLGSPDSTRAYAYAIDDFIAWYCSEPRLAFGKHVVLRYRIELESRLLAPATINVRLAAVRRLAYEAADSGLLSPELAAGIQRVKGAKKLGVRLGNWQGSSHSYRSGPRLGQSDSGRMDPGRGHQGRAAVPMCESFGRDLGRRDHGKGGLAYREGLRKASRHPATGAS